jgi:hypothetical protein
MKKLIIALAILCFAFGLAQAQDNNWFIRGQGGATVDVKDVQNVKGSAEICFLKNVYKNRIYLSGSYWNEAVSWETYSGNVVWFVSPPDPTKINLYLLTSGGYTHSGSNDIDAGSLGIGFGSVFAVRGFNPLIEVSFYRIDGDWVACAKTDIQVDLNF